MATIGEDSVSSQNQTVEIPKRRRLRVSGWDAEGNPIIPFRKEPRARILQELADKSGKTLEQVEMDILTKDKLGGRNWLSKAEWMPVDANTGDVLARLHVKTLLPEIKPDYNPDVVSPFDPQTKLYAFRRYRISCNALCRNIKPQKVQPGHVTYLVSVKPFYASLFRQSVFGLDGHPLAAIAEKVSFAAVSKAKWELGKPIIRGELDITFLASPPSEVFKVEQELQVEGTLVKSGGDLLEVKVDFIIKNAGKVGYTARTTFYTTPDPEWLKCF